MGTGGPWPSNLTSKFRAPLVKPQLVGQGMAGFFIAFIPRATEPVVHFPNVGPLDFTETFPAPADKTLAGRR